jgi:hypothetical protein
VDQNDVTPMTSPVSTTARRGWTERHAGRIALGAIIIAVAAPLGEDALLEKLDIRTPAVRRVAELSQRASQLEQQSAYLEKQLAVSTAMLSKPATDTVEADARVHAAQTWIHTLGLVQLGAALRRPGPFDLELAMVRASGGMPPEVTQLLNKVEPYAATGVPGIPQLQRDFLALRARIQWNETGSAPIAWVNRMIPWTHGSDIRKSAEPTEPGPPERLFAEAAVALGRDNLAGAVAIVQNAGALSREVLNDWMEDAEARVALDELARRVNDIVLRRPVGSAVKPALLP